jgi:hypothetical protein
MRELRIAESLAFGAKTTAQVRTGMLMIKQANNKASKDKN